MLSKLPWLQCRKAKHVDEPKEDWYLQGLLILDRSERVRCLQAQMRRSVLSEPGFYFELLFFALWGCVSLKHAQSDESPYPYWFVGLLLILVIHFIQRFERVSITRHQACLELATLINQKAASPSPLTSVPGCQAEEKTLSHTNTTAS